MATLRALARAKVNLTLHVGAAIGEGAYQGYHPLSSLVAFADWGDAVEVEPGGKGFSLTLDGPFADGLSTTDNLALRAAEAARDLGGLGAARIRVSKHITVAAGLGGGSADAAAVLRLLLPEDADILEVREAALGLGADVPACLHNRTCIMEGIGETVLDFPGLGHAHAVLCNPGVGVSTAEVFRRFDRFPAPARPAPQTHYQRGGQRDTSLRTVAREGRNDLQVPALQVAPEVGEVVRAFRGLNASPVRMSGSGATVFGLFTHAEGAAVAAARLKTRGWWARACRLGESRAVDVASA